MNSSSLSFSDSDSGRARLLRRVKSMSMSAAMSRVVGDVAVVLVCLVRLGGCSREGDGGAGTAGTAGSSWRGRQVQKQSAEV
jgi:hypothetical protein